MRSRITAIVLTFNEAIHIRRCIERLTPAVDRILVVDSYSTDGTDEIARSLGAEVLQNTFTNHAAQFNWGVANGGIESGWILRIDADEYLEAELAGEVRERLDQLPADVTAVEFRRKVFFQGRWIRWGGFYPLVLTRLWRVGAAHIEQRWMDEHIIVEHGETVLFRRGDLVDDNLKDITWWTEKHNAYTTRQMVEFISLTHPELSGERRSEGILNRPARIKRFLRNSLYARSPLYIRAVLYFLQRYIIRLGFLDGRRGFVFHVLQGFWNFLLVDVKIAEARQFIAQRGIDAFREHLAERHGMVLAPPTVASAG